MNAAAKLAEKVLGHVPTSTPTQAEVDNTQTMKALIWHGKNDVRVVQKPRPLITDPRDVLLKITATTVCGSDLHLYSGNMPDMKDGDILGHEFMGIVQEVGSEVKKIQKGMRVVVAFDIACGNCEYCDRQEYTACDTTNPSKLMETMYGHRTAALFGYSHLTGGIAGGQAEYVRVPFADVNCLPVPDNLSDEKVLYLSDIVPTAYHATELGQVKIGDKVAIWGLGPVGLLCARWCQLRGASKIIGIDSVPERLKIAANHLNIDVINFNEQDVCKALLEKIPGGVDCSIEAAGFECIPIRAEVVRSARGECEEESDEWTATMLHKVERAIGLETDTADILSECIYCTRKFGRVSIIGVYSGYCNHFPIGALMEKGLLVTGSQSPTQKYWEMCLEKIKTGLLWQFNGHLSLEYHMFLPPLQSGEMDPTFVVTHKLRIDDLPDVYKKFKNHDEGMIKVFIRP